MALTKPKAAQVDFTITDISDPRITLNKLESPPVNNVTDIGIIAIRGSAENNIALIWDESLDEFAVVETAEVGIVSGNMVFTGYTDLHIKNLEVADITSTSITVDGLSPLTKIIDDLAPQLGADLDVNYHKIISVGSTAISLAPDWYLGDVSTNEQKIQASDPEGSDSFGWAVAIYGDTAIVGAYGEDTGGDGAGAAYIFIRSGVTWAEQQKIQASDVGAGDSFGYSVAIDGDTVIVGARTEDAGTGAAYVFTRSGVIWTEEQKIQASDKEASDYFGGSVSIDGDTVIVGAYGEDTGGLYAGAAYVFTRNVVTWTEEQKIQASDVAANIYFGNSVAIYGDTVIVGAEAEDTGGVNVGAAYIFTRSGVTWTEEQKIQASDKEEYDSFGNSVAIYGDTVIVGADAEDTGGAGAGAAYIFTRSGVTWTEEQKIQASDVDAGDSFGYSVSIYDDIVIIGARTESTGGSYAGAAYIFTRSGTTWTEEQKFQANDKEADDYFGNSVFINGNSVIVGAHLENTSAVDAGAAYFYEIEFISSPITIGEGGYSPVVKFLENTPGSDFVGLKAPDIITTSRTWVLPQDDPSVVAGGFLRTDANGVMSFATPSGSEMGAVVDDLTPQLGGDLDVNGKSIVSVTNGSIIFTPDGTGTVIISNETALQFAESVGSEYVALVAPASITTSRTWILPQDDPSTVAGQVVTTDASGVMSFTDAIDGGSY